MLLKMVLAGRMLPPPGLEDILLTLIIGKMTLAKFAVEKNHHI